jgi:hypothetical protein
MGEAKRRAFYRQHVLLVAQAQAERLKRSESAKKAAATRKANAELAAKRSEAAKRGAATAKARRAAAAPQASA